MVAQRYYRANHRQESLRKNVRRSTTAKMTVLKTWSGTTAGTAVLPPALAVLPLGPAVLRLGPAVLPLATETAITFAYELRIEQTQACWIQDDKSYPNSGWKSWGRSPNPYTWQPLGAVTGTRTNCSGQSPQPNGRPRCLPGASHHND